MGSTGEPDRKRRHFSSIPSTPATAKKNSSFLPSSEEKKLDTAVLQYKNQKLCQQLEAQKAECFALESKYAQRKEKQKDYEDTLVVVDGTWNQLLRDLESHSVRIRGSAGNGQDAKQSSTLNDQAASSPEDTFLCRLLETGATDSCSMNNCPNQMEDNNLTSVATAINNLRNIIVAIDDLWNSKDQIAAALLEKLPKDDPDRPKVSNDLAVEVKNLRAALGNLHLEHRSMVHELQSHRDSNAKNKAELKRLAGELEGTIAELEESNCKLATLKAQKDAARGSSFPVLNFGNKHVSGDKTRDKQKDLQDMESTLKEYLALASSRQLELKSLHEERIGILKKLSLVQNTLKDLKYINSSKAYLLLNDQLEKSKAEVIRCRALCEKLQVEKDNFAWREAEVNVKVDLADVLRRASAVADSQICDLEKEIQKQIDQRNLFEIRLEEASREPGRKEIISEFKALLSSFPKNMSIMQSQLSKYKEAASEVHSLRAEVQALSNILDRKVDELKTLSGRSVDQNAEIKKLKAVVNDLKDSDHELKLFLEMYRRESTDSRDVIEARDLEYQAWAHVQSLKSSLDEHGLELRVKAANEAEAISQQRLATAEAEIADLRQKFEASRRDESKFSEVLKSKHEEGEAYLSEIETIGQAYEDMQTQNQHLLQQITERDDYNIKLVLEGAKARQLQDALRFEKQNKEKELQQVKASLDFYEMKGARVNDQLKVCSEQVQKLAEDRGQSSSALENTQKRLLDFRRESQRLKELLAKSQSKVEKSRIGVAEVQIELEKERFNKKRVEEELEGVTRKSTRLSAHTQGSSVLEKLQKEAKEYRDILNCSICHERPKEVPAIIGIVIPSLAKNQGCDSLLIWSQLLLP
ncbi:hypothetical protein BVC80_8511g8 [Macleaya cordata]|uniref:E3 ubiquitin protein ligase n=1 Tax=Macleaya cordata TaxID=56857 RepID=A0A200QDW0_MACCD|nr:hypothetical protein BVC80_8511g8 [Macleaya cordata]